MKATQDYLIIALNLLGALGLLIYGMRMMSEALQKMAGSKLRNILGAMTTNRLTGMLTGAFVTCAVQSSSATTVMTVSFVSAGLLTLAQAISIIMGANIGTTLTAWIMSLGYNVDLTTVVFPAFIVGMFLIYKKRHRFLGDFLFGIAFMFLSLVMLSTSGKQLDLANNPAVVDFFASFDTSSYFTIIAFLAIGTIITCIVQSSAAVMAITIMLCSTGVLPIHLGIALVMGENIGTTATANLAALGTNLQARRAALAHLIFNVIGVIWVLIVFYPFVDLVCNMVGYDSSMAGQTERLPVVLAMFHTCFNLLNTLFLIGLIPQMEKIVCWLMPEKKEKAEEGLQLKYIQAKLMQTPELSVLQAQKETTSFAESIQKMYETATLLLRETDRKKADNLFRSIEKQEDIADRTEIEIARYIEQVGNDHLSDDTKTGIRQMLREISEIESIGDACYNMARIMIRLKSAGKDYTEEQQSQLEEMMRLCNNALSRMNQVMNSERTQKDALESIRIEHEINAKRDELKKINIQSVNDKKYDYKLASSFADMVNELEQLGDYIINVVQTRYGKSLVHSFSVDK